MCRRICERLRPLLVGEKGRQNKPLILHVAVRNDNLKQQAKVPDLLFFYTGAALTHLSRKPP